MPAAYKNIELLKKHLSPLGYVHTSYVLDGEAFTKFTASSGEVWMVNDDRIYYPFPSIGSKIIAKSKIWSNELAELAGANLPATYTVTKDAVASLDLDAIINEHSLLVVKPYDSTLSRGLTTDITTKVHLEKSIAYALEFSNTVLIQQQVFGDDIRFIILDGKVKGVLLRQPPRVIGDGKSTVAQLIEIENNERSQIALPFELQYKQLTGKYIAEEFLTSDVVPAKEEIVELSREVLLRNGASIYNIIDQIHESYIRSIEDITQHMGKGIIAVDVFIADYRKPCDGKNYWFLEFNSSPSLGLSYCIRDGNHFDLLSHLIPMIDRAIKQKLS